MNSSQDGPDDGALEGIEQALLADDPDFVRRLERAGAGLPPTPAASPELRAVLVVTWCVLGSLALLSLAAGSLVAAAGTCVLALALHRSTRGRAPVTAAVPPRRAPRGPGRSTPAGG